MKIQKRLVIIIIAILAIIALCACAATANSLVSVSGSAKENVSAPQESYADWSIAVEGASKAEFTAADYAKLTSVKVDAVLKKKDGSETKQTWEGVWLKDVVTALGVTDYKTITLTASDNYSHDYTPDIVNDANTIIGTSLNGKKLSAEEGFVEAVVGSHTGNMWIKKLKAIKVNK